VRIDYRTSVAVTGTVIKYLAVALLVPLIVSLAYGGAPGIFVASIAVTLAVGFGLERLDPDPDPGPGEALLFVALAWLLVPAVGAIPYLIEAHGIPVVYAPVHPESTLANPVNALFESTSGVTTTGATVLGEISVGAHTRGVLMWRQLTQWLGGMGIIVLMVAILPELAVNGARLIDAEAPGPELQKLTPRIAATARVLWATYAGFAVLLVGLLYGLHLAGFAPKWTRTTRSRTASARSRPAGSRRRRTASRRSRRRSSGS
jgi:trk system potassium uptake protein TrkH